MPSTLDALVLPPSQLADFAPLARRAIEIEAGALIRFRVSAAGALVAGHVRLPFDVVAGRTLAVGDVGPVAGSSLPAPGTSSARVPSSETSPTPDPPTAPGSSRALADSVVSAGGFLDWLDGGAAPVDQAVAWLEPLPPRQGWRRVDFVPAEAVTQVVGKGKDLAETIDQRARQQSLMGSTALTVSDSSSTVEVPLSALSAVVSMGFLPPDSQLAVDTAPGWLRLAAPLGSSYLTTGRGVLSLLG